MLLQALNRDVYATCLVTTTRNDATFYPSARMLLIKFGLYFFVSFFMVFQEINFCKCNFNNLDVFFVILN